ncbi:aldo/keto reductase [Mycobacterium sp. pUA109]|uniref:aldo/keto reductase n=1 Tax=Mycobacterium sp. pUA109 TaxID=3238982 RepID=UPI00351B02D9
MTDFRTGQLAGRTVARIGYGAMQLEHTDRASALAVLRRAIELGINHIDTAEFYGDGVVNELIRAALHPYPEQLVLVSKVGAVHDGRTGLMLAQRPEQLRAQVEANLRRLNIDRLPVVNLRRADAGPGLVATEEQRVDLAAQLAELVALRDEGKIAAIGLSHVSLDQLNQALPAGIVCVQNYYNVLQRSDEPLLQVCREHELAWVPFFPLGSAFVGTGAVPDRQAAEAFASIRKVTDHPAVIAAAAARHATPAQVGLAWLLAHDPRVLLIPGTANAAHLAENVAAAELRLDADTLAALDGLADVHRT